jgi:hypothetical protein
VNGHPRWCALSQYTSRRIHYSITIQAGPASVVLAQANGHDPVLMLATIVDRSKQHVSLTLDQAAVLSAGLASLLARTGTP